LKKRKGKKRRVSSDVCFADEEAPETQYGFMESKEKVCEPALGLLGLFHLGLTEASERCSGS
jgi:hypothetical protein